MTNPDFRALCAELLRELQALRLAVADELGSPSEESSVILRARAALATPPPKPPTLKEQAMTNPDFRTIRAELLAIADELEGRPNE